MNCFDYTARLINLCIAVNLLIIEQNVQVCDARKVQCLFLCRINKKLL
jgi:hypothetical protein